MCAVCAPLSFDEFSRRLLADLARGRGREPGGRRERVPKEAPGFREAMRAEAPWLSDADFAMAMGTKRPRGESVSGHAGRGRAPSESSSATEEPPSDRGGETRADDIGPDIAIFDPSDLIAMRAAEDVAEHKEMDFYVRILGGAWALAHTGEIADGCSYFARAGTAQLWCRVFCISPTTRVPLQEVRPRWPAHPLQRDRTPRAVFLRPVARQRRRRFLVHGRAAGFL